MFLGIDIGTSSVKAVLVDWNDEVLGSVSIPLAVSRPQPGFVEQHPEDWLTATLSAIDAIKADHRVELAAVEGIGLSGQMHGATLLGHDGRVLRPCILWNDQRSAEECAELEVLFPAMHSVTGNLAMPGLTAPKLLWVRKHEPDIFAQISKVVLPKAYVGYRLTGDLIEEMSDAAGTLWLDTGRRDWSDEALAATGLSRSAMPTLIEGSAPRGALRHELAARWGMARRPVLAGGAGDNAAGAIGLGAVSAGSAFISLGTSGVLWVTTEHFAPNPVSAIHAFCHAVPNRWSQMGVILSAASCLSWWAGVVAASEADLLAPLGPAPHAPSSVLFLPYLSGERTPHNDATIRGAFLGLAHETDRSTLTQAVLEGVAFAFRDCLDAFAKVGTTITEADAIGGGSRSGFWVAALASVLGLPLHRVSEGGTGAALGAARLGRMAATGESPCVVCRPPRRIETVEPLAVLSDQYSEHYARYRALYPKLKSGGPAQNGASEGHVL